MPVASISPGTIRKPPPIPKKPESAPVASPSASSFGTFRRSSCTPSSPAAERPASIRPATTSINIANSTSNFWPSTILLRLEPANAPSTPAAANTKAQRHFTVPRRACCARFAAALTATASALVPIATCALGTPTR